VGEVALNRSPHSRFDMIVPSGTGRPC